MTYRVVFAKRFQSDGNESNIDPTAALDVNVPDGVVADKAFVERFEPEAKHNQEVLDEDDAFLGMAAAEVWEYTVVNERKRDFEDAIANSETVMEFEVTDDTVTDATEVVDTPRLDALNPGSDNPNRARPVTRAGSGVRATDDGPGGEPTGDPSAGGEGPDRGYLSMDEVDGIGVPGSGIDDLTIKGENDPSLGLTDYGDKGPDDWAADTGLARNPDRGIISEDITDDRSTLAPDRK